MNFIIMSTLIALFLPSIVYMLAWILSMRTNSSNREKMSPFECGFDPNHNARIPFSMRFFLLAIIFIVFDIEIVLLIPIPLITMTTNMLTLITGVVSFLIILILGLLHEWNQGSLNWYN